MRQASFLTSKTARILSIFLLFQLFFTYGMSRYEVVPTNLSITKLSPVLGSWQLQQEGVVDKDTLDILKADEVMTRTYASPQFPVAANLFVAYFRTQRTGQTPHSPKNCLPGNGWVQSSADMLPIEVPGRDPIVVNHYVVSKGESRSVVMYWYQSRDRVVASEYRSKVYSVLDSIRYNRSDIALVRVVVPVVNGNDEAATTEAVSFVKTFFVPLRQHFPA